MVKRVSIWMWAVSLVVVGCAVAESNEEAEKAAVEAAQSWLGWVDSGDFAKSWSEASSLFREAVSQADWEKQVSTARRPFGKLISRRVNKTTYATSLPGAPDGQYVVIEMKSTFENKDSAVETITPMLDKDGHWRVSGYYIR